MATVVVGFVVGFALGGRSGDDGDRVIAADPAQTTTSTSTTTTAPTAGPSSTEAPASSTTAPPTTVTTATTAEVPETTAPPTSAAPVTSVATTAPPPTTPPPTFAPSRVVVSYATDGRGRLILPRSGSANLVVTNEGGLAQQWLVTGTGFSVAGPTQGSLAPGQTVTITVVAPREELPSNEIDGVISVLGAINPTVPFVIPAT